MADGSDEHALLLQMSYDLARLKKQSDQAEGVVDKGLTNMERRAKKAAANLEEAFTFKGANLEGALGEIIQSSRLRVLDSATEKVGLFGGALESLGPIGLVAGAGIAAVGAAVEGNLKLDEWALELTHQADALNFTTIQLQQYQLAAAAGGISSEKLIDGLKGINQTVGNLESGLIKGKQLQEFVAKIGISPEQLRSWGTFDQQLPHILDALAKLNPQERAGLAERFRIDPETLNSIVEMRDKIEAASHAGADFGIMSDGMVRQQAEVEKQLKLTSQVTDNNFRKAFLDLSPVILGVQGVLERFSSGLVNVEAGFKRFAYNVSLDAAWLADVVSTAFAGLTGGKVGDPLAHERAVFAAHQAEQQRENAPPPKPEGPPPTQIVSPHGPKAKADHAPTMAADDLSAADKLLAEAQKALATSFEARAAFEISALKAEETKADQKLSDDLKKAKTQAERAELEKAQTETAQAYTLKRQLVANQLAQQQADQALAISNLTLQGEVEMLQAQTALGGSIADRGKRSLQIFDLDEQIARSKLQEVIDSKTASDAEKARAALELVNLNATAGDRRQKITNDNAIATSQAAADIREQALQAQIDQLDAEKGLHTTTERRREIALQLFALDEQLAEGKLREQIAQAQLAGETEKAALLQKQLASMQSTAGARGQAVSDANPGNSWQAWADQAKAASADVGEALAKTRVDGIEALNDSLFDSEGRFNSLSKIAHNVARSMITDFEKFSVQSFEGGLFGGQGGNVQGAGANPLQSIGGAIGHMFGLGGKGGGLGGMMGGAPTGAASAPFYVIPADTSGGALTNGWSGIFGGGDGSGGTPGAPSAGGLGGMLSGLFKGGSGGGGGLAGLFGGGSGGGGGLGGIFSSLMSIIPGFAGGGDFIVGGAGGVDRNLMAMKVSRGERVSITTPQQQRDAAAGGIGAVHQTFNFPGASVDGFKRSSRQWARSARMGMQYAGSV
jgi:hypothetical protein